MLDLKAQSPAWRAAYIYPTWRTEEERREFAVFHEARTTSTDHRVVTNHYGDWMFSR